VFNLLRRYAWVLEPFRYEDADQLVDLLGSHVIVHAEGKVRELAKDKKSMISRSIGT